MKCQPEHIQVITHSHGGQTGSYTASHGWGKKGEFQTFLQEQFRIRPVKLPTLEKAIHVFLLFFL